MTDYSKGVPFRCTASGNIVLFYTEYDVKQMLQHPEYEEVKEEVKTDLKQQKGK